MITARSIAWALCLTACSTPAPRPAAPPAPGAAAPGHPAAPGTAPLPPGVLARAQGTQGVIQVEEKDGLRVLTIDGKVQAAVRPGADAPDPVVPLLRAMRPGARRALVIGLGSGRTAGDLAGAGFEVEAVELEAAVIDMARTHFGYKGHAEAGDGRTYLEASKASKARWDVILIDALTADAPPAHLVDAGALAVMVQHLTPGGVVAIRLLGEPQLAEPVRHRLENALEGHLTELYGSGVGAEPQNLVLFGSQRALNTVGLTEPSMLWPIPRDLPAWAAPHGERGIGERRVELIGYLIRMPDGALAIDLPHWEMGAVRYLLRGAAVADLQARLPAKASFPTEGDIGSDGDTRKTLRDLLGGGGAKRSDVRFSPIVVAVDGVARLLSVVHPDAASGVPAEMRDGAPTDDRLPYGGALYDFEVTGVGAIVDMRAWDRTLVPLRRAAAEIARGRLGVAAPLVAAHADAVEQLLGPYAERTAAVRRARKLAIGLTGAAADLLRESKVTDLAIATACERARELDTPPGFEGPGALGRVVEALTRCADRFRKKARTPRLDDKV
jgi:protein-L-isoaspartate O-methyltransferase